jgi:hypothetical protein
MKFLLICFIIMSFVGVKFSSDFEEWCSFWFFITCMIFGIVLFIIELF